MTADSRSWPPQVRRNSGGFYVSRKIAGREVEYLSTYGEWMVAIERGFEARDEADEVIGKAK